MKFYLYTVYLSVIPTNEQDIPLLSGTIPHHHPPPPTPLTRAWAASLISRRGSTLGNRPLMSAVTVTSTVSAAASTWMPVTKAAMPYCARYEDFAVIGTMLTNYLFEEGTIPVDDPVYCRMQVVSFMARKWKMWLWKE